ncbi:MAG TPA: hypothetical protein VFI59_08965 [Actinomycetota bacterium]|nr:hypothetical protein [Actinomycetota bacterium]
MRETEAPAGAGILPGHVVLHLRYGSLVTPWWHQMNLPPDDLDALVRNRVDPRRGAWGDAEGSPVGLRGL